MKTFRKDDIVTILPTMFTVRGEVSNQSLFKDFGITAETKLVVADVETVEDALQPYVGHSQMVTVTLPSNDQKKFSGGYFKKIS